MGGREHEGDWENQNGSNKSICGGNRIGGCLPSRDWLLAYGTVYRKHGVAVTAAAEIGGVDVSSRKHTENRSGLF